MIRTAPACDVSELSMNQPPKFGLPELNIITATPIAPWYFMALYDAVGAEYYWVDWHNRSTKTLKEYCNDPMKTLYTLMEMGTPAGFYILHEMGTRTNLAYFGLTPSGRGMGFGKALLQHAIATAWSRNDIQMLTVETCTLDDPRALPLYQNNGFEILRKYHKPAIIG